MPPPGCHHNPNEDAVNSPTSPLNFLDQNYQELLQNCLTENTLYNDELFPPDNSSIGLFDVDPPDMSQAVWPFELVSDPNLIVDGVSRFDYAQGSVLGNCWFLASIGALTFEKDIMKQVMPAEKSFTKDYAGIFHFRFWRFGKWIDVVIDDQLPTIDDELLFVCSKMSNEFWPALLEKAYAKVCGSYADLNAGFISEALMDFTGGTHMYYELNTAPADLWNIMECAFTSKTLIGCSSNTVTTPEENEILCGIVAEHTYTVTGVFEVTSDENPVHLVRLLNPWGRKEWRGDWSDGFKAVLKAKGSNKMRSQSGRFSSEFFIEREPVAQTDGLVWLREVMKFFRLEPGEYLIVPCTENPGETASFVLSIFSKNETHFEHIQETSE
ncbi:calpain-1 catalytic subunit-like [Rhinichthys klamathensis goyatoka]|uniref:calpain-1 catalytic subunit-like n=1 Tax=Rhinichthys klamathensis goyatoka TaxID=3034132 RepID=UPI0024B5C45C|nr:calpain-1 catalytic subunit-like [Rhinichthys klamathensis goyatoka]